MNWPVHHALSRCTLPSPSRRAPNCFNQSRAKPPKRGHDGTTTAHGQASHPENFIENFRATSNMGALCARQVHIGINWRTEMKKEYVISATVLAGVSVLAPEAVAWNKKEQKIFDQSGYTLCDAKMMDLGSTGGALAGSVAATLQELGNRKALVSNMAQKLMTDGKYDEANRQWVDRYITDGQTSFRKNFPEDAEALQFCPPEETYTAADIQLVADAMNTDDLQAARTYMATKLRDGDRETIDADIKDAKAE